MHPPRPNRSEAEVSRVGRGGESWFSGGPMVGRLVGFVWPFWYSGPSSSLLILVALDTNISIVTPVFFAKLLGFRGMAYGAGPLPCMSAWHANNCQP